MVSFRPRCRVRKDDGVRFETLRAVHGHHPHLVARAFPCRAFGFWRWPRADKATKPCSDGVSRFSYSSARLREFVDGVVRFQAESRPELLAAFAGAKHARIEM